MENEIINNYHKGNLLDKVLLITALVLFVIAVTLYAMASVIPTNLMHPNDLYNSVNYIDRVLLIMRLTACVLILLSIILVIFVRIKNDILNKRYNFDILLTTLMSLFVWTLSILIYWLFEGNNGLWYKVTFYYIVFPLIVFGFSCFVINRSKKVVISLLIGFSLSILFHYHLTFGINDVLSNFWINMEYLLYGLIPALFGLLFSKSVVLINHRKASK